MKPAVAIYLAGRIKKEHERNDETFWSDEDLELLRSHLTNYDVSFLNPAFRSDDLSDQRSVFGRDMLQVFCSNFVFADVRERRGLGVGAEMMWAKMHRIPVIAWAPRDSHYNKSQTQLLGVSVQNWVHPFVESLSDKIVENISQGAEWIHQVMTNPSIAIKDKGSVEAAMHYYQEKQLHKDLPMQELIAASPHLTDRINL